MEQHPVPQNVTTFQFRLIGDMTIKQFGYLAGGIIAAYISYKLPLPFFFTWPLAVAAGLLGFGLAFVPIEERPMDIWIASFFRNTYSPTQWVWSREAKSSSTGQKTIPGKLPASVAQTAPVHHASALEQISSIFLAWLRPVAAAPKPTPKTAPAVSPATIVHAQTSQPAAHQPATLITHTTTGDSRAVSHDFPNLFGWLDSFFRDKPGTSMGQPAYSFTDAFASSQKPSPIAGKPATPAPQPSKPQPPMTAAPQPRPAAAPQTGPIQQAVHDDKLVSLQTQLSDMMRERERLEKELITMKQKAEELSHIPQAPPPPMRQAAVLHASPQSGPTVRIIAPGAAKNAGLPRLTTFPNIVTGIVKDQYGNLLPGMLITVRDRDDIPLRALKTNRLGQFAASTPLPDATYIVEIEDPKGGFVFDKAQIQLNGSVAPPIEVTAKSQKQLERDRLAKEIFGNQI